MSPSARNPLLLPEILRLVGPLLSRSELLVSLQVCSTWNLALNPLLWTNVRLPQRWMVAKNPSLCPSAQTLHRNANHIFELTCADLFLVDLLIPKCCRLEKLVMQCLGPQVCQLLLQNQKTLKQVHLQRDTFQDNGGVATEEIVEALQKCEGLERLALNDFLIHTRNSQTSPFAAVTSTGGTTETDATQEFYRFIKRVPHLELRNSNLIEPPRPVLRETDPAVYVPIVMIDPQTSQSFPPSHYASPNFEPSLPGLESLVLFGSRMNLLDQTKFLHHCPNLQSLSWTILAFTNPVNDLGADMHFCFHKLVRLDLTYTLLEDSEIAALLARTPNVAHLKLTRTKIGRRSMEQIVGRGVFGDIVTATGQAAVDGVVPILDNPVVPGGHDGQVVETRGLRDQLQSLDILDCALLTGQHVRSVLWHCPKLKELRAPALEAVDLFESVATSAADTVAPPLLTIRDWACTDLEILQLSIMGVPDLPRIQEHQRAIMAQMGRLARLRSLSIEPAARERQRRARVKTTSLQFSLDTGLDELATLIHLRSFYFGDVIHRMGVDEYEWMSRYWPLLRELGGDLSPQAKYVDDKAELRSCVSQLLPKVKLRAKAWDRDWRGGNSEDNEAEDDDDDDSDA
ncbi:hypothetical protein BGZ83_002005 [Gryganskiella cystojenkinii]|nr:hypothetical protein BGZ83_002005 [Gryganskiella cystojenkinii]